MAKVLIVDDEKDIREAFKRALEADYEIALAANGKKALELIKKEKFELILLDIRMPGLTGINVLEKIRKIQPEAKVVFITVVDRQKMIDKAVSLNVDGYLIKPISKKDLTTTVKFVLSKV